MREAYLQASKEELFPDSKSDGDLSDTTLCGSLWDQATLRLDKKQQTIISQIRDGSCKPDELLAEVNKEVEKCEAKQWSIYTTRSGRRIFLRDVLDRIAGFLQKITAVGDTLVQYDPGHLSIPWAFARFLLVAAVSDSNSYGAFLESMEKVTDTISRYVIIESLYLQPGLDCTAKLEDAIISLYTAILKYLCKAKLYFGHNTMVRVGISVLKVEQDASKLMADISSEEEIVEKWMAVNGAQQTFRTSVGVNDLTGALADFRKVSDERVLKLQNALMELQKPVCRMASQMDYICSSIEGNEKTRIIKWISSLGKDFEKNHSTKSRSRLTDSGKWLLRNQKYRHWLNSSSCSVLWLHGGAGYGKSFLVSLVVDRMIEQREENPNAAYLAYFYCTRDTAEPKRAQPVEILRSIIRQLSCLNSQPIRSPVIEKWNERAENESDHGLEMDECVSVLLDLTRDNPAIICIDALDECDITTRRELLDAIGTIINCSEQIVKVFVSSRREDDFLDYFDKWEALEISAKENRGDIVNFIDVELKRSTANKTLLHGNVSEQLIKDIKQVLLDGADGMFRWVSACLQTLCDPRIVLEEEVREALGTLPKELKDVYDIICSQIERRSPVARTRAGNVLKWLLHANKPLSCNEMIKAATMDPKTSVTKEQVLSLCCNFVKLDEEIGVFQFVHLSVREYLEKRSEYESTLSHAAIAQSCLQACLTNMKPKRRANLQTSQNKTFYDYAQVFWPLHCQMAKQYRRQPPLENSFRTFLCTGKFPSKQFCDWVSRWSDSWFQMELESRRGAEMGMMEKLQECMDIYRHGNPIFVACVFGFTEIIDDRRQAGMGSKDSTWRNGRGRDPYEVAIRYGQEDVINILRSTTSLDSPAARESALLSAVSLGEMSMVTMLLDDHLDLEITEEIIAAAASTCDVPMLKFLADRYLDFTPTERLLLIAASNESHGQHIIKFLFEEGGDEIEDIDKTALLEAACTNGPRSLEIVQYIIDNMDALCVTEDIMKAASKNQFDAYHILRALLKLDNNITITEDIVEAAVRNASAEPLRLLISRFPTSPVTWSILNTAARNLECGHMLLTMLLGQSSEAIVDEDLLLAAVVNEKLAPKLLDVLLPRVTAAVVTNDVLRAAAQNRFFGHRSIEELLKHVSGLRLEPSIIEAGSRNLYYAPEVVKVLLEYDSAAIVTTQALQEAAANNECGEETLELLLQHRELTSKSDHSSFDQQTDPALSDTPENPPLIPPEVVEAAASNPESGTDVMRLLLKWSGNLTISAKAVENASGNLEFGEEILSLWVAHKRKFEVTPGAIERAAGNQNIGHQVLTALLRCNRRVTISNEALEIAAINPYHGFQLIKTMFPRWKGSDGFEEIISRAARNAQLAVQIMTYLLKQQKASITSDTIESCAASAFADKEMMAILVKAAPGIPLGLETVEAASNRPQHFFDILAVLRWHDPNVPITKAAMYSVVRLNFNIVETIQQLKKYHSGLTITEGLMKSVVQNINANEATIVFLCNYQKEHSSTDGKLPVSEEVMAAALQNPGNGAVFMVKMLLSLQPAGDWNAETDERRLEVAVNTYRAEAMISLLVRHAQQHHRAIRVTRKALRNAAQGNSLKILLKLLPDNDKELITAPEVLSAAGRNKSHLESLISYAAERRMALPIDQAVFEQAVGATRAVAKTVIKFWSSNGQSALVQSCITEKVLEKATSNMSFFNRPDGIGAPETSMFHWLFRMQADQGIRIPLTQKVFEKAVHRISLVRINGKSDAVEYFQRILHRIGGGLAIGDLITTEALKLASASTSEYTISRLLSVLPKEKKDQFLTRDVLLAAAGSGSDSGLEFLLKQKDFQQYSQYYKNISKFHKAAWSIMTGKERALLRRGVYPNAPVMSQGRTMLSFAAGYNELASVRVFMKFPGFDLDAVDYDGRTALHFACIRGSETVVELLLARGADTTINDVYGLTAEGYAIANSHFMVARMVRDYEAAKDHSKEIVVR